MLIVDSQVHIWNTSKLPTPICRQVPVLSKDDPRRALTRPCFTLRLSTPSDAVALEAAR
jgi:hypothetical protein